MKVGVVCDDFVAMGFRLAGLAPAVATSPAAARELLETILGEPGWGVVLYQEELVPEPVLEPGGAARSDLPLLIPFPGPELEREPGEAERYVAELLRRAVGYRVRLR